MTFCVSRGTNTTNCVCDTNHWTPSTQIDTIAKKLREDSEIKTAAAKLKGKFLTTTQALLHGDLHSGSVMVKEGSTYVIDPEFAFYGPMGFDVGAILANIALAYFAQSADSSRGEYQGWLLEQMVALHSGFTSKFLTLWDATMADSSADSELFRSIVFNVSDSSSTKMAQKKYMSSLWADTLGFMGMKMIRRIVGIAHVEDLESIKDEVKRADCEVCALNLGISLVVASQNDPCTQFADISALAAAMKDALY